MDGDFGDFGRTTKFLAEAPEAVELAPQTNGPVLTASDVTDANSSFVADPVINTVPASVHPQPRHMFLEIYDGYGIVSHAVYQNGEWQYDQIVLDPGRHHSLPQWFEWGGDIWMQPSTNETDKLYFYRFDDFPTSLTLVESVSLPNPAAGGFVFPWNSTWFHIGEDQDSNNQVLHYSDTYPSLTGGTWYEHPASPLTSLTQNDIESPPVLRDNRLIIPANVKKPKGKGRSLAYLEVDELTTTDFSYLFNKYPVIPNVRHPDFTALGPHMLSLETVDTETIGAIDGRDSNGDWQIFEVRAANRMREYIQGAATTSTTVSTQSSGGCQTVNLSDSSWYGSLVEYFDQYNKFNIAEYHAPISLMFYGQVGLTSVSGSPFTVDLRVRDTRDSVTLFSETHHVNQDSDVTLTLGPQRVQINKADAPSFAQLQIQQDSGADVTVQGDPLSRFLELPII